MSTKNFKAFLIDENLQDGKVQVRRFNLDFNAYSYLSVYETIKKVFPDIGSRKFNITWRDAEKDEITISSNEELRIAMQESWSSFPKRDEFVLKLYVNLCCDAKNNKAPEAGSASSSSRGNFKITHPQVTCDGCEGAVDGFRYKCLQCPDFDLCSTCEAKSLHPKHCMIRIPVPLHLRGHAEKRLLHLVNRLMRKTSSENLDESKDNCPFKNRRFGNVNSRQQHFDQTPSWINTFTSYLNDWSNIRAECPLASEQNKTPSPQQNNHSAKSSSAPSSPKPEEANVEFLKNIGETIAQFLDPLGIDVDVQVKTDGVPVAGSTANERKHSNASTSTEAERKHSNASFSSQNEAAPAGAAAAAATIDAKLFNESRQSTPERYNGTIPKSTWTTSENDENQVNTVESTKVTDEAENSKTEEWTLLDTDNIPTFVSVSPDNSVKNSSDVQPTAPTQHTVDTSGTKVYPTLPNVSDNIWHENPKIQRAVEAMIQMGFTNDGGWLTQLLVSKNGDISKALDILQPVL